MLPPLIILKAAEDRHVLLSLIETGIFVKASIVDNSKYLFTHAEWRSDGLEGQPQNYTFKRVSSRSSTPKLYTSTLCKTTSYLTVPWHEPICIYTMTYSGVILPSTYFKVFKDEDREERWHFKKPSMRNTSAPVTQSISSAGLAKIPSHIVRAFVESAIYKKEVCPITLEALVMGNVAMTACGHLFEKEALASSLSTSNVCPNCRAAVQENELVMS